MCNELCGLYIPREIESNSAALLYSINVATKKNKDGSLSVDIKKAEKLFKFMKQNVDLPNLKQDKPDPFLQKSTDALDVLCKLLDKIEQKNYPPNEAEG